MKEIILNGVYRSHLFLDRHEAFKFLLLIFVVGISNVFLVCGYVILFLISFILITCFTLTRVIPAPKSKRSLYNVPEVGDILVIKKSFFYNGEFLGHKYPHLNVYIKPNIWGIKEGTEWLVDKIEEWEPETGDWNLHLISTNTDSFYEDGINIKYFKSRGYWKTKVDIRNDKLKKLGL